MRKAEGGWEARGEVGTSCEVTGVTEGAGEAMLNDRGRAAGAVVVNTELRGCGNMTDVVETDSVKTGSVEKTGSGKLKAEAVVEDLVGLTGATVIERASGKSEGVENGGTEGGAV